MNEIIPFTSGECVPDRLRVLAMQGVPVDRPIPEVIEDICEEAIGFLLGSADPRGLVESVSIEEFASILPGEGLNAPETPVGAVFGKAAHLAMYAATIGADVSAAIGRLFEADDYATAAMLDSAASLMTDSLSDRLAKLFLGAVAPESELRVLPYSPGYCGWHVSGQRKLFAQLKPERIGVTLNESCLMQPIKSVSGVLIAAPAEAHKIRPEYPFCNECKTKSCAARLRALQPE